MLNIIKGYRTGQKHIVAARTPAARLDLFRALSASYVSKDWRDARAAMSTPESSALAQGFNTENPGSKWESKTAIWYCHTGPQFRNERWADDVAPRLIKHTGWFSDADENETYRGFVFNLPHGRFGAGHHHTMNGERVYLNEVHDDEIDAATSADHEAEKVAEVEREYSQRWRKASELRDDIADDEKKLKRLYALRNTGVDDDLRDDLRVMIEGLRGKREELATAYADIEE